MSQYFTAKEKWLFASNAYRGLVIDPHLLFNYPCFRSINIQLLLYLVNAVHLSSVLKHIMGKLNSEKKSFYTDPEKCTPIILTLIACVSPFLCLLGLKEEKKKLCRTSSLL